MLERVVKEVLPQEGALQPWIYKAIGEPLSSGGVVQNVGIELSNNSIELD